MKGNPGMEYRNLGKTGLKVSELCLGSMQFGWTADEPMSLRILTAAYDAGINFIDTADIYSRWVEGNPGGVAETIIGKWLTQAEIPRDHVVLATKVRGLSGEGANSKGLSRAHIMNAVEGSLRRLGTDYIDLYQAHWYDEETPIEETLGAFDDLIRQGKVRYIGASNYPAWRLMEALWSADTHHFARYDSLQPHYNLVNRAEYERELAEVCQTFSLGVLPYSPLAAGFLTGKYQRDHVKPDSARLSDVLHRYFNDRGWKTLDAVQSLAAAHNLSASQVSIAWLLTNPGITSPVIGPRNLEQLKDNLGAAGVRRTAEEKSQLDEASAWQDQ
jgi:aryl-alcohol dehydrogenase-like predicted oxidoreductase